jgi:hypothetical protein
VCVCVCACVCVCFLVWHFVLPFQSVLVWHFDRAAFSVRAGVALWSCCLFSPCWCGTLIVLTFQSVLTILRVAFPVLRSKCVENWIFIGWGAVV